MQEKTKTAVAHLNIYGNMLNTVGSQKEKSLKNSLDFLYKKKTKQKKQDHLNHFRVRCKVGVEYSTCGRTADVTNLRAE